MAAAPWERVSMTKRATCYTYFPSPLGELLLAGDGASLYTLGFADGSMRRRHEPHWQADAAPFEQAIAQLRGYFAGELHEFELPLAPAGTSFQRRVWDALQRIPYGETRSYGELARTLGNAGACRAVGAANRRNPIPIIIPCHRVIGGDGSLTGFGGGLATKQRLLALEREHCPRQLAIAS